MSKRRYASANVEWNGMQGRFLDEVENVRIEDAEQRQQRMRCKIWEGI